MKNKLILIIYLLLLTNVLSAQKAIRIEGNITDEKGESLPGVSVVEIGTTNGVLSDLDGNYKLTLSSPKASVKYSYIGYKTKTIKYNGKSVINIKMEEDSKSLDEVVVVGYGVQKKVNLTGSVASIDFSKQTEGRTITCLSSALSGLVAGMNVYQTTGKPGDEGANIRIRGNGTFNSNTPLVLVDGIEWGMSSINPNDVENISVLKDAASTAIYGTRAANGVILITTKKGNGKPHVTYSYSGIVQKPYNNLEFVSDYITFMKLVNEGAANMGKRNVFSEGSIEKWEKANANPNGLNEYGVPNHIACPNTDWFNEIYGTGYSQEHNISLSGSSENVRYVLSLGYLDNKGIMNKKGVDSGTEKFNFRTNLETDITKWLTIGTKLFGQKQKKGISSYKKGFEYLTQTTPGIYPGEPDLWGEPALSGEESSNANNVFRWMSWNKGNDDAWRLNASLYGILKLYKGLSLETTLNYSPTFYDRLVYEQPNGSWDYVKNERFVSNTLAKAETTASSALNWSKSADFLLRYNTTIKDDHDLGILLGTSRQEYFSKGFDLTRQDATDWSIHELSTYGTLLSSSSSSPSKWGLSSYFGRVNYAYKSKYLLEANIRADGSSRFGSDKRWGYFPSFSGAWRLSEESFIRNLSKSISNLKLRFSWGKTGNNSIGNYDWMATYNTRKVVMDGSNSIGLLKTRLSNEKLHWEATTTTDLGIDFGFFNNKLSGEIDFYSKNTSDILYHPALYLTMGEMSPAPENLGKVRNSGVELTINWTDRIGKDFEYKVGANFSFNSNKVTKFKGKLEKHPIYDENNNYVDYSNNISDVAEGGFSGYICEGKLLGETYILSLYHGTGEGYAGGTVDVNAGPKDGMIRTKEDLNWVKAMIDAGYSFGGLKKVAKDQIWYGDFLYANKSGDMNYGDENDKDFTGHSNTPKFNLGFTASCSYKNFDFSMVWAGAFGHYLLWNTQIYNNTYVKEGFGIMKNIAKDHYFYDPENESDPRTNIQAKYPRLMYGTVNNNGNKSDWYEYKGDYLKLRNIQIGYTVPQSLTNKILVNKLRAFVSIDNILTITNYPGQDPEIGTSIGYPLMRQISFGGQITF